jgi:hypothetical protein
MALPSTGITTSMVASAIGAATNDVGQLCIHPNVNMWSKWKPVRFNSVSPITQANLEAVNYGIGWKSYASIDAVKTAYENREEVINYNKPRGDLSNEPYRLGDFRNYEHSAIQPIAGVSVTQQAQNIVGGQTKIVGSIFINGIPKAGEIGWGDLNLGSRRLAIALYDRDTLVKTAVANSSSDTFVEIDTRSPLPVLEAKRYNAFLFFTNNAGTTTSSLRGIPNHLRFGYPVSVVSNLVLISIEAHWSESNPNQIVYSVKGTNQTGSSVSLLNCSIRIRNQQNECTSTIQQGEVLINLGTLTLPHTGSGNPATVYSNTRTVTRSQFPSWKMCWNNGGAYPFTTETNIIGVMI